LTFRTVQGRKGGPDLHCQTGQEEKKKLEGGRKKRFLTTGQLGVPGSALPGANVPTYGFVKEGEKSRVEKKGLPGWGKGKKLPMPTSAVGNQRQVKWGRLSWASCSDRTLSEILNSRPSAVKKRGMVRGDDHSELGRSSISAASGEGAHGTRFTNYFPFRSSAPLW